MSSSLYTSILEPLGPGDLIDRAVRLYRQNFFTLIRISAVPVVVSAIGSVLFTLGWRGFFVTDAQAAFAVYFLLSAVGFIIWAGGVLSIFMVMGGAARNLVRHLLWHEPITVRETYRNVRQKFWSLLGATLILALIVFLTAGAVAYVWLMLAAFVAIGTALITVVSGFLGGIVGVVLAMASLLFALWLFFLVVGRFAYVPQILLVEGQGVFASISRSMSLASGNAKRLAALFLFTVFATASALMILWLPLVWYGQVNDIPVFTFQESAIVPIWYEIANQVILQLSLVLLAPVWMLGLSLLYVDERVRQEAYDVELMAARQLGEMPPLVNPRVNPLRPALGAQAALPPNFSAYKQPSKTSTLGLR